MGVKSYISINEIISKFLSDADIQHEQIRISDFVVWCSEALKKIGGYNTFEKKVAGKDGEPLLEFENYKAKLPCDFYKIVQLGFSSSQTGGFESMRTATGNFDSIFDGTEIGENVSGDDRVYTLRPPYVYINQPTGYGLLAYIAIKTDSDGYPMIPDDEYMKEAMYWYLQMKYLYPLWMRGKIRDAIYVNAERKWHQYCDAAYGAMVIPDNDDEMQSIINVWTRLIPNINAGNKSMKYIGEQEKVYRHFNR